MRVLNEPKRKAKLLTGTLFSSRIDHSRLDLVHFMQHVPHRNRCYQYCDTKDNITNDPALLVSFAYKVDARLSANK